MPVDGRLHWKRSHIRFKELIGDWREDAYIAGRLNEDRDAKRHGKLSSSAISNLAGGDNKYGQMDSAAAGFSRVLGRRVVPVVLFRHGTTLDDEELELPSHEYVHGALVQALRAAEIEESEYGRHLSELIRDNNFLRNLKPTPSKTRKLITPTRGSTTEPLDAIAMVLGLGVEYYHFVE